MSENHPIFSRYPELKEFIRILRQEVQAIQRPPEQIVMDDNDVMKILKISKRTLQNLRSTGQIPYHCPGCGSKKFYLLSDILDWLKKSRVESIFESLKIKVK
ncbi:MAG: helix-turn-helix domain-containing protein [Chitinophagaceae bacterium]|nr:helix-turn-helix domain-containing protein [Chitinophagaceae bacterium]